MSVALPPYSELAYVRQQRLDIADEQLGRVVKIGGKLPDLLVDAERPDAHLNLGPLVVRRRRGGERLYDARLADEDRDRRDRSAGLRQRHEPMT